MHARHDGADLRRLAELGIAALDWRHPPAGSSGVVIVESDESANALLKDIVKSLAMAGLTSRLRGAGGMVAPEADVTVIRFGATDATASPDGGAATLLPTLTDLRGNAAAKRSAWSQLRALLRR